MFLDAIIIEPHYLEGHLLSTKHIRFPWNSIQPWRIRYRNTITSNQIKSNRTFS